MGELWLVTDSSGSKGKRGHFRGTANKVRQVLGVWARDPNRGQVKCMGQGQEYGAHSLGVGWPLNSILDVEIALIELLMIFARLWVQVFARECLSFNSS